MEQFELKSDMFLGTSETNHRETVCHNFDRAVVKSYTFYRGSSENNAVVTAVPGTNPRLHLDYTRVKSREV